MKLNARDTDSFISLKRNADLQLFLPSIVDATILLRRYADLVTVNWRNVSSLTSTEVHP